MKIKTLLIELALAILMLVFTSGILVERCSHKCEPGVVYLQDYNASEIARVQTEINAAHMYLLHRMWIDNPKYIEEDVMETDEFNDLSRLLHGDFEDTFMFWDDGDSILYYKNKRLSPDVMPKKSLECEQLAPICKISYLLP